MAGMWLDDASSWSCVVSSLLVIQPRLANAPKAGRKRRILGTILLSGCEATAS
jgi:hypothetical protein